MSINDFIASFQNGARPNKFRVQITWPARAGVPNVRDEIVVTAAGHPASVLGIIQVPYQGRQIPVPGDRTFEEWTINVLNDRSFSHRNVFERWSSLINSHEGNIQGSETYKEFTGTLDVVQLGQDQQILKTYKLHNAWPTNIAQIDLGYDQNDVIEQYPVTFAYSHWTSPTSAIT